MSKLRSWSLGSWSRDIEGCIATFDRDGERWPVFFSQRGYEAKVVTLCTPETIWRDLQGTREVRTMRRGPVTGIEKPLADRVDVPERSMLGKIGRRDLLLGWETQPKHG
jgi:hypothetical protein